MMLNIATGDRIIVVVDGKVISGKITGYLENNNKEPVIEMDLDSFCQNEVISR